MRPEGRKWKQLYFSRFGFRAPGAGKVESSGAASDILMGATQWPLRKRMAAAGKAIHDKAIAEVLRSRRIADFAGKKLRLL
jgi:hypothetical protein